MAKSVVDMRRVVQVLVSIQSLILVPEPYFNEPGFEQRGNQAASWDYNKVGRGWRLRMGTSCCWPMNVRGVFGVHGCDSAHWD